MTPGTVQAVLSHLEVAGRYLRVGSPERALELVRDVEQELQRMVEARPEHVSAPVGRVMGRLAAGLDEED